ncbi:MAG: four helix bundle suffix domain-containing protein [Desulfobacterales bacterium]|jgi:four helix bundle suffix protein|nr:four helix bundle suffix domain-containing protein [Desulfobacterales bacterium]
MAKIRPGGGYRELRSFQMATVIYDATYWFCERFLEPRARMSDQMVQAARSGRQNIAEGSRASATSTQTELRLVNVARSSLEELLLDYEDYLRHRRLPWWAPDSSEALAVRQVGKTDPSDRTDRTDGSQYALYARWLDHPDPAVRANALVCLIHQANYLLDRQIEALEKAFIAEGGYSEQLATARIAERSRKKSLSDRSDRSDRTDSADRTDRADRPQPSPDCPKCGKPMALRTAQKGKNAGRQFWGCTGYPECKNVAEI